MTDIAIMIEGQDGVNWPRWQRLAKAVDEAGFAGLFRSDHFTNPGRPEKDSLELWVSLTWLASHTRRIEFGPLVSPVSFRDPNFTARMAIQVDNLSAGRLRLGVGAGWQEREHTMFNYDLLDIDERFARFREGLDVITRLINSDKPVDYSGRYYRLEQALLLPRPERPGRPPILIGGNGERRTLPLVAQYASEWNAVSLAAGRFASLNRRVDELAEKAGRRPGDIRRSLMTTVLYGRDQAEVDRKLAGRDPQTLQNKGVLFGLANQVAEQVHAYAQAGADRLMLRWEDLDDIDGLEAMAREVLPLIQDTGR